MTKTNTCMKIYLLNQKWHFSSPEPKANRRAYRILMVRHPAIRPFHTFVRRCRSQCSKIFSSETPLPIKANVSLTFSVCKCPWYLEKIDVSQLFFYAQFYLFWIKYFMKVEFVFQRV